MAKGREGLGRRKEREGGREGRDEGEWNPGEEKERRECFSIPLTCYLGTVLPGWWQLEKLELRLSLSFALS